MCDNSPENFLQAAKDFSLTFFGWQLKPPFFHHGLQKLSQVQLAWDSFKVFSVGLTYDTLRSIIYVWATLWAKLCNGLHIDEYFLINTPDMGT